MPKKGSLAWEKRQWDTFHSGLFVQVGPEHWRHEDLQNTQIAPQKPQTGSQKYDQSQILEAMNRYCLSIDLCPKTSDLNLHCELSEYCNGWHGGEPNFHHKAEESLAPGKIRFLEERGYL
jgi:hypothetical protein